MTLLVAVLQKKLKTEKIMPNTIGTSNEATRQTWLAKTLTRLPSGLRLLDAGAGELANKQYCSHLEYLSQDFCQYEGAGDSKALQMKSWDTDQIDIVGDITNIPEDDNSFDVILCTEVFEHLPDPVAALVEFQRLLKKGGTLIITAPFCSLTHFSPYHFSTGFNRYYYEHHLSVLDFKISNLETNGNYFEYLAQELRRLPSIADKYSSNKVNIIGKLSIKIILMILAKLSKHDSGSHELLCFGYHVVAVKD